MFSPMMQPEHSLSAGKCQSTTVCQVYQSPKAYTSQHEIRGNLFFFGFPEAEDRNYSMCKATPVRIGFVSRRGQDRDVEASRNKQEQRTCLAEEV